MSSVVALAGDWSPANELRLRVAAAAFGVRVVRQADGGEAAALVLGAPGLPGSASAGLRALSAWKGSGAEGRAAYPTKIWGCTGADAFKLVRARAARWAETRATRAPPD